MMSIMDSVTIYMSTYNGAAYLEEQIQSILNQRDVDINLIIRDDGSSNKTKILLKKYEAQENITVYYGENLGYANSFLSLISSDYLSDYYGFADQDDVWEPNKIKAAIERLKGFNPFSLYASSLKIVDQDLLPVSTKKFNDMKCSIGSVLSRNRLAGCTMVFKKELNDVLAEDIASILKENKYRYGHDGWVVLYSLLMNGNIVIDDDSHIKFRRHSGTVTNVSAGVIKRIKNEWYIFLNKENKRVRLAKFLLEKSKKFHSIEALHILKKIVNYRHNILIKIGFLLGNEINSNILIIDMKNKLAILLNRY